MSHDDYDDDDDNEVDSEVDFDLDRDLGMLGDHVVEPAGNGEEQLLIDGPSRGGEDDGSDEDTRIAMMRLASRQATRRRQKKARHVSFDKSSLPSVHHDQDGADDDEDDDDDEDFEPPLDDEDNDEDDDWLEDVDSDTDKAIASLSAAISAAVPKSNLPDDSSSDPSDRSSSDASEDSEDDSDSDGDSDSDDESDKSSLPSQQGIRQGPDVTASQLPRKTADDHKVSPSQQRSAPYQGMTVTKKRNERRRQAKKLIFLKSQGILPQTATKAQLLEWEAHKAMSAELPVESKSPSVARDPSSDPSSDSSSESSSESSSDDDSDDSHIPETTTLKATEKEPSNHQAVSTTQTNSDFESKRQALLAAIASGGVDIHTSLEPDQAALTLSNIVNMAKSSSEPLVDATPSEARPRRAKLDVLASQRLLYGSLGVRRPKNGSEKDGLRKTLAAQAKRNPVTRPSSTVENEPPSVQVEEEDESLQDPNLWKKRLNLTAVECFDEEVEYIRPPFPFRQRWDPQMKEKKRKRASKAYTANKKGKYNSDYQDSYDVDGGDALDYDDAGYDESAYYHEAGVEEDAAADAEAQLLRETITHDSSHIEPNNEDLDEDDLPSVPQDLSSLPLLTVDSALPGAIVTFTRLEVSAATGWRPETAPVRVTQIQDVFDEQGSKVLQLKLAKRDVPKVQYDANGRRLFSGYAMELDDDDDDEDNGSGEKRGVLEVPLNEVLDGRIVRAAPDTSVSAQAVDEEDVSGGADDKDGLGNGLAAVEKEHVAVGI